MQAGAAASASHVGDVAVPVSMVAVLEGHDARVWHCAWRVNKTPRVQEHCTDEHPHELSYTLATCSADKTVKLWTVSSVVTTSAPLATIATLKTTLDGSHTGTVRRVCFSPDGTLLASASFDKTVVVWNASEVQHTDQLGDETEAGDEMGAPLTVLEGHESEVKGVAWNPSGNGILATCGRDKTVWFWEQQGGLGDGGQAPDLHPVDLVDMIDFEVIDVKHGHEQDVKSIVWHPSGEILVSVSYDDSIKFWRESEDTDEWECVRTVSNAHKSTIWDVRFDEEGGYMVTCGDDCCVKVWAVGVETRDEVGYGSRELQCACVATVSGYHDRPVYSVDVVRDDAGRLLVASGGGDDAIVVVQVDVCRVAGVYDASDLTNSAVGEINIRRDSPASVAVKSIVHGAHGQDVNCVRWRPRQGEDDAYVLASCGDDGDVRIWTYGVAETNERHG